MARGRRTLAAAASVCLLLPVALWTFNARAQGPRQQAEIWEFAPPNQNLLRPLLRLAPPGQASVALQIFEQIHELDRKLVLHPRLSPELQSLVDKLPAPEVIAIEMPALYSDPDLPWHTDPSHAHYIAVDGRPDGAGYVYGLAEHADPPAQAGHISAVLSVVPRASDGASEPASAFAEFKASLYLSAALDPRRGMDAAAGFVPEMFGTLAPPWDQRPGVFNQHDRAALARLRRDLPATSERLEHYLEINNVLDEFSDASAPWVLFNLNAGVREDALAPFPHLQAFWHEMAEHVDAQSTVYDQAGHRWLLARFHRGRITITFMLRRGMLTPMDASMRPAGPPLPIEKIQAGRFYTESTISVQDLGMRFGLTKIRFETTYRSRGGTISFDGHMTDVPQLIAPRMILPLTVLLAGKFLETIARGNSGHGMTQSFSAAPGPRGGTMLNGSIGAELRDAPALALLARMASAFAPSYAAQAREEQRRLVAEFFKAFDADYRRSRPLLLKTSTTSLKSRF